CLLFFFFSSRRRHTRFSRDWSSDVCSSDLGDVDGLGLFGGLHEAHLAGRLSHGADDLVVAFVTDEEDGVALAGEADGLGVHFREDRKRDVYGKRLETESVVDERESRQRYCL